MRRWNRSRRRASASTRLSRAAGDYIATLRKVADDPDPELRQRVLGILAREKDGFAQKKLLEGLKNPDKALVPPEKALQLLSYDVHAEAYSAARAIVSKPPNDDARREALRLLAADATSAPLFEKLLRDKNELREIRQISASALHALKPEKLQAARARDPARQVGLRRHQGHKPDRARHSLATTKPSAKDKALLKSVDRLSAGKASTKVQAECPAVPQQVRSVEVRRSMQERHNGERAIGVAVCGAGRRCSPLIRTDASS